MVYSKLLDFLEHNQFNYLVKKYEDDQYVKNRTYYNQFAVLIYGQFYNRERLRDVMFVTQVLEDKAYCLGFGKIKSKSTLADANNKRDYRFFEKIAYHSVEEERGCRATGIFKFGGKVYVFDSTTIELCMATYM